jgi:hypothetical protein
MKFHIYIFNFDFQYKPKTTIILNSMLSLVGIMNIMQFNSISNPLKSAWTESVVQ